MKTSVVRDWKNDDNCVLSPEDETAFIRMYDYYGQKTVEEKKSKEGGRMKKKIKQGRWKEETRKITKFKTCRKGRKRRLEGRKKKKEKTGRRKKREETRKKKKVWKKKKDVVKEEIKAETVVCKKRPHV